MGLEGCDLSGERKDHFHLPVLSLASASNTEAAQQTFVKGIHV